MVGNYFNNADNNTFSWILDFNIAEVPGVYTNQHLNWSYSIQVA
jgi:hypothetical protein